MTCTYEEYQRILNHSNYAKWHHTNLHLHTPATPWDWDKFEQQSRKAEEIKPEIYFEELNKTSLDIVAITDHNTIKWCAPLMKLAEEGRKNGTSKLHILPGVEITTYEGPHIIAIFDEDLSLLPKISSLLHKLDLSGDGLEQDRVSKEDTQKKTMGEIFTMVNNMGGLIIAPHINSGGSGIWGNTDFRGREDVLDNEMLNILGAPSESIKRVIETGKSPRLLFCNMNSDNFKRGFTFINTSDCHRIDDFELNTTWIKLSEPNLNGIKQIVYEPELRVSHQIIKSDKKVEHPYSFCFSKPEKISYPFIIGVSIRGGNLDGVKVTFSPHQNSIIGKNYAGKSAILDVIRFALDDSTLSTDDKSYQLFAKRLKGILKEGSVVNIYINKENEIYGITKVLSIDQITKEDLVISGKPNIYLLVNDRFEEQSELEISNIFSLEAYPQGEVVKIKENSSRQIQIVDSIGQINDLKKLLIESNVSGHLTLKGLLDKNSDEIQVYNEKISNILDEIKDKEKLISEIETTNKLLESGDFTKLQKWMDVDIFISKELEFITSFESHLLEIDKFIKSKFEDEIEFENDLSENPHSSNDVINFEINDDDFKEKETGEFKALLKKITYENFKIYRSKIIEIQNKLITLKRSIDIASNIRTENYQQLLEKIKEVNGPSTTNQQDTLMKRVNEKQRKLNLIEEKEQELKSIEGNLSELISERQKLLEEFQDIKGKITNRRRQVVGIINENAVENVCAEIEENADKTIYKINLDEIFNDLSTKDTKVINRSNQIDLIVNSIDPKELSELLRNSSLIELREKTGITENTAKILLSVPEKYIHKLESTYVSDIFKIKFRKEGDSFFTSIDEGLSGGEQALALISVAMIPKFMPLLIDQPEDELGPSLITDELVNQIRNVKLKRQLIFVTHVANIPVLGDSEQIIYVKQIINENGKSSRIDCSGSLEQTKIVKKLLELDGGEDAFIKRQNRYSCVIKNA